MRWLLLGVLVVAGCGGPKPPPPPAVVTLQIEAGRDQNPTKDGQPAPVAFHILQLTSTSKFERADEFALLEREKETLGDELASSDVFVLAPGEGKAITKSAKANVVAIGVVVGFRDTDRAVWRAMAAIPSTGTATITVRSKASVVSIESTEGDESALGGLKKKLPSLPKLPKLPGGLPKPAAPGGGGILKSLGL